jgi:uridine kinase
MEPSELFSKIIGEVESRKGDVVFMVGIDGVDAAGKTTFAASLSEELRKRNHNVIEASMDGFHNPREIRYKQGKDSPEGYYRDSFNINAVMVLLIEPLRDGRLYQTQAFDYKTNLATPFAGTLAEPGAILVFEGVFSFGEDLRAFWDYRVYLDISPEESLRRGVERDPDEKAEITRKYRVRYLPGQELYKDEAKPRETADIIVDYNDPENPGIL